MPRLKFNVLWRDDDDMMQLQITAAGSMHSATHETYIYPEALEKFGESLKGFPRDNKAEVLLEVGSPDPKWYGHMKLRVFLLSPTGRSALEVTFDNRGDPPAAAQCHFYLAGEPAGFNRLGQAICDWIHSGSFIMDSEWSDA